ncbi:MAG: cytochrome oxidase small assembly protein [Proteobacteria bacterium]|nr:cytochrome oxidase small assembly protein [Pseudomonadota bacterium]
MSNNLKTALILLSIAAVFFLGVIAKRIFIGA